MKSKKGILDFLIIALAVGIIGKCTYDEFEPKYASYLINTATPVAISSSYKYKILQIGSKELLSQSKTDNQANLIEYTYAVIEANRSAGLTVEFYGNDSKGYPLFDISNPLNDKYGFIVLDLGNNGLSYFNNNPDSTFSVEELVSKPPSVEMKTWTQNSNQKKLISTLSDMGIEYVRKDTLDNGDTQDIYSYTLQKGVYALSLITEKLAMTAIKNDFWYDEGISSRRTKVVNAKSRSSKDDGMWPGDTFEFTAKYTPGSFEVEAPRHPDVRFNN